jgi:hypothetical protein
MASVRTSTPPMQTSRTSTVGMRRIKSHEPGQRVMTEAIAFLFTYYANDEIAPSPEEFFALCRHLSLQTYHETSSGIRRRVSSRLLGSAGSTPFLSLYPFLHCIEPLASSALSDRLIQAQNIALRALITYTAFVDDNSDKSLKTHIVEPFLWFSSLLFHDSLDYRTNCVGSALKFIQDGCVFLIKRGGRRLMSYFEAYSDFAHAHEDIFKNQKKYLDFKLVRE